MAYIGVQPTDTFLSIASQQITGNGGATYTLDYSVSDEESVAVFVNNVRQNVSTYTVSGTSLTLGGTISSSDSCWVLFLGRTVGTKTPANNSVTGDMLSKPFTYDDASNGSVTGISVNNDYPTTSTASAGTGSGIRFGVNDGSFTSAFGDARGSEILSVTQASNGRSRDIVFKTDNGGTLGEVMRINSSASVGIGETSPLGKLHVKSADSGATVNAAVDEIVVENSGDAGITILTGTSNTGGVMFGDSGNNYMGGMIYQHNGNNLVFKGNGNDRMIIDSSGRALFSTTGTNTVLNSSWKYQMRFDGGSDAGLFMASEANANGTGFIQFNRSSTTSIGNIVRNGTNDSVNYNTTSDYRMKENVIDLSDATTRVKQLQPKRFSWISQESDTPTVDGFLAHEVSSVVPEAITGTKDEVDADGNPKYQGIDQSKLVPLLTASLKEAIAKIEELETRIATLENA